MTRITTTGRDHTAPTHRTMRELPEHLGRFVEDDVPFGLLYWLGGAGLLGIALAVVWMVLDGVNA